MGKLVVTRFVSVDEVFQDPGGVGEIARGGWSFKAEDGEASLIKFDELMAEPRVVPPDTHSSAGDVLRTGDDAHFRALRTVGGSK